ncbi:MAG: bile acid:sodium symporter family protein [Gemmataceae bacterium]
MEISYAQLEYPLACAQLVFVMLGMGATLRVTDFLEVVREPRPLLVGLFCVVLISPLIGWLMTWLLPLPVEIAVGLILIALMPGGAFSNLCTFLGRGNLALSIAMTAIGTLASLFTVPFLLPWLAYGYVPADFQMPVELILQEVFIYMGLSLVAGMLIGHFLPRFRVYFAKWCVRVGILILLVVVVGSLVSGRIQPGAYGLGPPLAIIFFCLFIGQLTMLPFRILKWPTPDRLAVGVEVTIRNVNLAVMLNALIFPATQPDDLGAGTLYVVLFYGAVSLFVAPPLVLVHRHLILRHHPLPKQTPTNVEVGVMR